MYNAYTPHYKRINVRIPSVISYLEHYNPDFVSNWDGTTIASYHIERDDSETGMIIANAIPMPVPE